MELGHFSSLGLRSRPPDLLPPRLTARTMFPALLAHHALSGLQISACALPLLLGHCPQIVHQVSSQLNMTFGGCLP